MLPFHPYADLFPLIEGEQFDELVADVKANDLREKIVVWDGAILDGRNRYRAGLAAGLIEEEDGLDRAKYFVRFVPAVDGDALKFVISKNLQRRHLSDIQRASIGGKIANLGRGRPGENPPIGGISTAEAAATLNVAPRQIERARFIHDQGVAELGRALDAGAIAVSAAERIARLPDHAQREEIRRALPNGARAIMGSRTEPDDSLDYFPTPPWATRALFEYALPEVGVSPRAIKSAWEPACGEGHIAEVLKEYVKVVYATDIFDYGGKQDRLCDFLGGDYAPHVAKKPYEWIITNPPFGDSAIQFVHRALELATIGVAMFFRSQWAVEGVERYESIFSQRPPTLCAFFAERVNLCKGRWDPDGTTATAYCWLIWKKNEQPRPTFWIPPGCRKGLVMADDRERFAAWSIGIDAPETCDADTGEILPPSITNGENQKPPAEIVRP